MIRRICARGCWLVVMVMTLAAANLAPAATSQQVEDAIKKGAQWLYSRQRNGTWEEVNVPVGGDAGDASTSGKQWGGRTALATYALLASGESLKEPRIQSAVKFLRDANIIGTYALGMRAQVWQFLPRDGERRMLFTRDARLLMSAIKTEDKARGLFNYYNDVNYQGKQGGRYDHSCSNYGVLGLWAAAEGEIEMPLDMWGVMEEAWRRHQYPNGGWAYEFKEDYELATGDGKWASQPTMSMTSAGVATLFITQDYLHSMDGLKCTGSIFDPFIARGVKWMAGNFDNFQQHRAFYTLYNVSRVGVASGYKYFDTVNWYQRGLDYILSHQRGDGSWDQGCGDLADTCFCLLFLVRGRAPVVMNKLDYTVDRAGDNSRPPTWNQRPRDVANFTRWLARQIERDLNWQIVNLKAPVDELHDAPILFISGSEALNFTAEDRNKLKQFVEQGGLILGHADCAKLGFTSSFTKLGKQMFPLYEFKDLPAGHVIYTDQQFKRTSWRTPPRVQSLGNGARELMILLPVADPGKNWQTRSFEGPERAPVSQLVANIFLYAVEKQNLRFKGETYVVSPNPSAAINKTIKLARLQYNGNWDPEPGGWRRLAAVMQNSQGVKLETTAVKLGTKALKKDFPVAHLTGTAKFTFDAAARAELKEYVEGGGTLIVDACGGSGDFAGAVAAELKSIWPSGNLEMVKKDAAVFSAAQPPIGEVAYRNYATKVMPRTKAPRLLGMNVNGRTAVYVSNEDLSVGLVGHAVDGIVGYDPKSATTLMAYMVLSAGGK